MTQLDRAREFNLDIPITYITHSKERLKELTNSQTLVTKAIQENIACEYRGELAYQRVTEVFVDDLPDLFFPSMFQEVIKKDLEIRAFYLDGIFYPIAFFILDDSIDMRDHYKSHQTYKFSLPKNIENSLDLMMKSLGLKAGSIDMILGEDGKFYFLEVNPEGQYDWVSVYGGYCLHEKIANYLIKHEKQYKKN